MAIPLFFPLPARTQATPPDSETHGNLTFSLSPEDVNMQLFSWFIQDEIALVPDKLYLTVGTNVDHNYYTGFNTLPSARVAWTASSHHMFWAAISQADRTPAETDTGSCTNFAGFRGPEGTPTLVALVGNTHIDDEGMTSYETGYRTTLLRVFCLLPTRTLCIEKRTDSRFAMTAHAMKGDRERNNLAGLIREVY